MLGKSESLFRTTDHRNRLIHRNIQFSEKIGRFIQPKNNHGTLQQK